MVALRRPGRPVVAVAVVVLVACVAVGLAAFQPWRLVTNTTVDEAFPAAPTASAPAPTASAPASPPSATGPALLARGSFVTHEHRTSGSVAVYAGADGRRVLRIEGLETSDGPDLHVWLTDAPVIEGQAGWRVFDDGEYVELGRLKGNRGNQNYDVPAGVDLAQLTSVSIWCDRFNVSFGAVQLRAA